MRSSFQHPVDSRRHRLFFLPAVCLLVLAPVARAQRKYVFGTNLDVLGGLSNRLASGGGESLFGNAMKPYFAAIPTLDMTSSGNHSMLKLSYSAVGEHFHSEPSTTGVSHVAYVGLTTQAGKRTRIDLSNTFFNAPYYSVLNVPLDTIATQEGFRYTYEARLLDQKTTNNHTAASVEVDTGQKSFVSVRATASLRKFDDAAVEGLRYSDQTRYSGDLSWNRRISARRTWTLKYSAVYNEFESYGVALTQTGTVGYSGDLSRSVTLRLEAGPSYVRTLELDPSKWGYMARCSLELARRYDRFSLSFEHLAGDASGIGSISDSDHATLGWAHAFGRRAAFRLMGGAFRSKGDRYDNPYDGRGINSAAELVFPIGRYWALVFAGDYSRSASLGSQAWEFKRAYVALRFRAPEIAKVAG